MRLPVCKWEWRYAKICHLVQEKRIEFDFDASQRSGLSKQMTDGLRRAILTGRYSPGEVLPTIVEWAKMLGVSIRVPEAAIAKLVSEGLIVARRRHGCIVAELGRRIWRGHVLVVVPDTDSCYYSNVLSGCVRTKLSEAGYLVSPITVRHTSRGRFDYDLSQLEFALKQSIDLAVLVFNYRRSSIARMISRSGVPFVEFADAAPSRLNGCAGSVYLEKEGTMEEFLRRCENERIGQILQVGAYESNYDIDRLAKGRKIAFSRWIVDRDPMTAGTNEGLVRGGMDAFLRRFAAQGRSWLPDLLYFTDDNVASGALTAMLSEGIKVPGDVRVATMSNWGLGPVMPYSLARFEMNPYAHGVALADMAIAYLSGRLPQGRRPVPLRFIGGDSFPL